MRFPKMHIAQSVLNRLTNYANQVESTPAPPVLPYQVPQAGKMGAALDEALSAQPGQMAAPAGADQVTLSAILEGTSPAEALAQQGVLDDAT